MLDRLLQLRLDRFARFDFPAYSNEIREYGRQAPIVREIHRPAVSWVKMAKRSIS
ncbi:hypothetical protein BURPS1710b_3660 [Burkholderia pseudomallei 1710b]|uniref:Uncharacterized protein n=2 Tax=Burkholderia pseudomallei TaxID=28450 RepID=Q3JN28_BURP1|nr:hypothetical protein BURPS1710b_3660 [Burkholderia pseudomallei 1710b]EET09081.1 conserved hypothetical protein [Burkholderia pseudomallei 1710a]